LTAHDLLSCGQKWLACSSKKANAKKRAVSIDSSSEQVEYCGQPDLSPASRTDQLGQRLLDANRTIGQPNKITVIFGRKVTKQYKGKLQTVIGGSGSS
jgi:hypothetical protein